MKDFLSCWMILLFLRLLLLLLEVEIVFGLYCTESTIQRLAQASSLSYLSLDRMESSPYFVSCLLEPIVQVVDDETESGATIFVGKNNQSSNNNNNQNQNQNLIVVACRGSANPKNFGTNLKFNLVPATRLSMSNIPDNALVHQGFQDASVGLWRRLGPHLVDILKKQQQQQQQQLNNNDDTDDTNTKLVFTGHSLGAATALLGAVHYEATFGGGRSGEDLLWFVSPTIVTFGGPKLCNDVLARFLRQGSLSNSDVLHLVHTKDPVLANNQKLWKELGFEDVGIELQCDPNKPIVYHQTQPQREKEKKKRGGLFGSLAWNIMDHCNYMGVFVGPRF